MAEKKKIIAVIGPTATGKTALGLSLARWLSGEIVSCDSMQIYRGLEIGTAQPSPRELSEAKHHLIGFLSWNESFSVSDYVNTAKKVIEEIHARRHMPVLVGGTGLYARALLRGFTFKEECKDSGLRLELMQQAQSLGPEEMHRRLEALDPQSAKDIHPNNVKRVVRALEYCIAANEPFSMQARRSQQAQPPYESLMICPVYENRQLLYDRIDARVDKMIEGGLVEEAGRFYEYCKGLKKLPTAAQSIGCKELFPYFQGEIELPVAVENIKRESRRYAKRQLTWFAREPGIRYLYLDKLGGIDEIVDEALDILYKAGFVDKEAVKSGI